MSYSEHTNRTRKAQAIAAALRKVGADAGIARILNDAEWQRAAALAAAVEGTRWTDASETTRREVIKALAADERVADDTGDLFANIAAVVPHRIRTGATQ